ncbi:diaminopimelate epimerase [Dysgonomonadaceae bacterium PH5-43]|nr:diaminopimelate epimerase [Dysgonomonadaceae bacterium PH5-43]
MKFTKMHGIGNDYVYINCFDKMIECPEELSIAISNQHKGVGSDGLVLIMPSDVADFRMRMFNPDGTEAQMCGNASRCVGKYVFDNKLTRKTDISLETKAGIKHLKLYVEQGEVNKISVDMGEPILNCADIPVLYPSDTLVEQLINFKPEQYNLTCVSMGNPHAVIFDVKLYDFPLSSIGRKIERFKLFPERTNVEFVEILSPRKAKMRVWERGTGETQACGTGACAVLVAGVLTKRLERKATIVLPGGNLEIEWRESNNRVYMTGEAVTVFEGELINLSK